MRTSGQRLLYRIFETAKQHHRRATECWRDPSIPMLLDNWVVVATTFRLGCLMRRSIVLRLLQLSTRNFNNFNKNLPSIFDTSVTDVTVINRVIDTSINVELRITRCFSDLYIYIYILGWQVSNCGFFLENQRQFFHATK